MTLHITGCRHTCDTVPPSAEIGAPASSSTSFFTPCAPQQRSAQPPLEGNLPTSAGEDSVMSDYCYTLVSPGDTPPSCQPNSASPPDACKPPAEAAQSEATELLSSRVMYLKSVKCPHCAVVLYKKNLLVHIQRKHRNQSDIKAACHSKSKSVSKAYGLFDYPKGIHVWLGGLSCLRTTVGAVQWIIDSMWRKTQ